MSNRTNLSTSYHYTVTAASDNSAYLWSGHGLENAPNPTIYLRTDDDIKITNASGGHIMELRYDPDPSAWTVIESNDEINVESPNPGSLLAASSFTYICQTHPAMTGKLIVSQPDVDGKSDDGYGTGPLPENNADGSKASVSTDQIRTKINEIVTKGGIGGGSISVSDTPPDNPSEGDLWFDETAAALYVWIADPSNSWIQTSGGGTAGGASVSTGDVAPATPADGDLWFNTVEAELYVYLDAEGAWVQTNGGGGNGLGLESLTDAIVNIPAGWNSLESLDLPPDTTHVVMFYRTSLVYSVNSSITTAYADNGTAGGAADYVLRTVISNHHSSGGGHRLSGQPIIPVITDRDGERGFYISWANLASIWIDSVVRGGGGGTGPRAYVAFDGTAADMAAELSGSNSLNVSSITDNGPGDYTINYTNPIIQPIITIGYETRSSTPFHALYWGIIDQTDSYARIALGSNNVYYDHPYVSFVAH